MLELPGNELELVIKTPNVCKHHCPEDKKNYGVAHY